MTPEAPRGAGPAAVYRDDPRLQPLIGPDGPFEVEEVVVDGVPMRDFVRAPRSIIDLFDMGAAHAEKVHVVYRDERMTFGEMRARATSLARELRDTFGVRSGDRVALAMRNLPEFTVAVWGAALAGAIVTPLNSWWMGTELAYALDSAEVHVAVLDDDRIERLLDHGRPDGLTVVGVRTDRGDVSFADLVTGRAIEPDTVVRRGLDDVVAILHTSGTTDRPKGAAVTNRGMTSNLWNMAFTNLREAVISRRPPAPDAQPATLSAGPLFHIGGMSAIFGAPMGGVKMVLMHKWDVGEAVRLAQAEHLTTFGGVPTMARQIIDHPGVEQLGLGFRGFPMGGAAVPPDLPVRAVERFGHGIQLLNGYGLTETTSAVVTNVGEEFLAHPDSVGRPNLTADIRIVDPDDRPVPDGEVGEICVRSPQVVKGYWNNEEATRSAFVDGWFHTGDLGHVDADGYLHVVDRLKDVVIRGGENIYCAEVEAALHEHPGVADVAVVGIAEDALGERVCAVVVPRPGATLDLAELHGFATSRLAGFKAPEALLLTAELPETATGKVDKKAVRTIVADAGDGVARGW
jgi:long-chain acyl-CoA synthetase